MKILILGSGQVGTAVAQNLVEIPNHDVTIIDNDPEALRNIGSKLDVQTLLGNGSSPAVMAEGGAYDTDLLLALTRHDETNLAACKLASSLFNIPNRIARVRSSDYLDYGAEDGHIPALDAFAVTDSIHPEQLVTRHLAGLLDYPYASLYAQCKRAMLSCADAYRTALTPFGIRVLAVAPGYVDTAALRALNGGDALLVIDGDLELRQVFLYHLVLGLSTGVGAGL